MPARMNGVERLRVACIGSWAPEVRDIIKAAAPDALEVEFSTENGLARQHLIEGSDFLLVLAPIGGETIRNAPRLRMIHKWGIGVDKIDLRAAEDAGIYVAITTGANASPVAEHTVMLMLAVLRRLSRADRGLREGRWLNRELRPQCLQLRGKTVGIVGFGNIGRALARKLRGFETRLVYFDPRRPPQELEQELMAEYASFEDLLARSDIITIHCPGGAENRDFIDAAAFDRMRSGAILINAARGEIVNEAALIAALESGRVSGAGLDVFDPEPLRSDSPFLRFDNVVLTPHTAASVLDNVASVAGHAFANMMRLANGKAIPEADLVIVPSRPRVG
jgi:phosphoglycerate dehydrogenase-like enzyme